MFETIFFGKKTTPKGFQHLPQHLVTSVWHTAGQEMRFVSAHQKLERLLHF